MKLFGFILGVLLIAVPGIWYIQSAQPPRWDKRAQNTIPTIGNPSNEGIETAPIQEMTLRSAPMPQVVQNHLPASDTTRLNAINSDKWPDVVLTSPQNASTKKEQELRKPDPVEMRHRDFAVTTDDKTGATGENAYQDLPSKLTKAQPLEIITPQPKTRFRPAKVENAGVEPKSRALKSSWQSIWKPFHREASAQGFAAHLSELTGLTIDVRNQMPGEYVIGFTYQDQLERQSRIEVIETRTGLALDTGDES